jgi:PAS domain S-box-containing protein
MKVGNSVTAVTLDEVCCTLELARRPARAPDDSALLQAVIELATALASSPTQALSKAVELARQHSAASSAGITLVEHSSKGFACRTCAAAGDYLADDEQHRQLQRMPFEVAFERNTIVLMCKPARHYGELSGWPTPVQELLLVPIQHQQEPLGVIWLATNQLDDPFDVTDVRLLQCLAKFAAAAFEIQLRDAAAEQVSQLQAERDEQFRALMSATSEIVYRMSPDWSEMQPLDGRGFIASNTVPLRNWLQQNIPPLEHPRLRQAYERAIRGKQKFELEHQVFRVDGSIGWVFSRAIPIVDAQGQITEWLGAAKDISRRKDAEAELADIRARMDAALAASAIGTWSYDIPQDRVYGDASLAQLFSLSVSEVSGGPLEPFVNSMHPDDRLRVQSEIQATIQSGSRFESDYRVRQTDGSWRWVNARGQVQRDAAGNPLRLPGVVIDITERKTAEAELARVTEESERRKRLYEAILTTTPDFIYVFSLDYRTLYANAALITMWGGAGLNDVIGKTFLELGYEPWHAEMHCREIDQVRATKASIRGEVPFNGTYGRRIYDYIFVPVLGADGEVEAVAGTTRDVTERKSMEDELRDADRKKDEFIALLAHELRNPLAPLRNGLQILRLAGSDAEMIDDVRGMMDRQLGHMVRLIDDLLDVSRISRNKMQLRRDRVVLAEIVGSAVEAAKPLLEEAGHTLTLVLPADPVVLDADFTRLAQVFGNLLNNSTKYTRPGGNIHFAAEQQNGEVVITVQDTGIGIPADFLPKIFDMFSQVDRSVERASGGLGIGLALVKGLVEMHGGNVSAASPGEDLGTTITVRLPVINLHSAVGAPSAEAHARNRRRVLVVDDNHDGAKTLALMLKLLGDEVRTAHDGLHAIEQAQIFLPEIILMDVGMPRLNGLDATRRIKAEPWGRDMVIIALTGWGQEHDRERSYQAGCAGHLVKPVDIAALEKMLGQYANQAE